MASTQDTWPGNTPNLIPHDPPGTQHESARRFGLRDGIFQATTQGTGEHYLSAFALLLQATPLHLSVLSALPQLVGTWAQIMSVKMSHWFPNRTAHVFWGIMGQSLAWLPIVTLPFVFPQWGPELVIAGAALYFGCQHFTTPAWTSFVAELLHDSERGAYFARRAQLMALTSFVALSTGGLLLSLSTHFQSTGVGFALLFLAAGLARSISAYTLSTWTAAPSQPEAQTPRRFRTFLRHHTSPDFRRFLLFSGLMHMAVLISGPFFVIYLLHDLHLPYWAYGTWLAASIIGQFVTLPGWGRFSDQFGNKALLACTSVVVAVLPMLYLVSPSWPFLVLVNFFGGVIWAGLSLGLSNYVLDAVRPEDRGQGVAVASFVNAAGWTLGTVIGGWCITSIPSTINLGLATLHPASNLPLIFFLSGLCRLAIAGSLLHTFRELRVVEQRPLRQVIWELPLVNLAARWTRTQLPTSSP